MLLLSTSQTSTPVFTLLPQAAAWSCSHLKSLCPAPQGTHAGTLGQHSVGVSSDCDAFVFKSVHRGSLPQSTRPCCHLMS